MIIASMSATGVIVFLRTFCRSSFNVLWDIYQSGARAARTFLWLEYIVKGSNASGLITVFSFVVFSMPLAVEGRSEGILESLDNAEVWCTERRW